jgi:hypothetical protein
MFYGKITQYENLISPSGYSRYPPTKPGYTIMKNAAGTII